MIIEGCQGKPRTPTIHEKICPNCGHEIELFSIDTQVACENCGFIAYNDTLSCVQWCQYARQCVGDEMYEQMMKIAQQQKEMAAQQRRKKKEEIA
jgi:DNA-directed RNA polymerase subunit RPC12/RpoP